MKDTIFVEFLISLEDAPEMMVKIQNLEDNFQCITSGQISHYYRVTGLINSACASFIKLQDPFLSNCMGVSYISDELKDKYRSRNR